MPPKRAKATRASTSSNEVNPSFPAPPTTIPTKNDEQAHTPERSPAKQSVGITQAQKQALIDNLQLEITERARKLRAQYAMQAQGLRARLEMRVNRIPQALRKRNMQDLLDEHTGKEEPAPAPPVPAKHDVPRVALAPMATSTARKSLKRQSDQMSTGDDKENMPAESAQDLANPKKRTKTATAANMKATRTASRKVVPSNVLSPKSHNSRTLPRSPFKPVVPEKPAAMRPINPVKPSIQHLAPPKPTSRVPSRQGKRGAPTPEADLRSSEASNTSAGTTIVTKPAAATKRAPAVAKKPAPAKAPAVGRKPAAKKENVPPVPAGGGRTLRKRG